MKYNSKVLIVILGVLLMVLTSCGNSSDNSNTKTENQSQPIENKNEDSANEESKDNNNNPSTNEKEDTASEEDTSTKETESLKGEYLQKLNDTKKEIEEVKPEDDSTYALKKVEGERYEIWDGLLNEIYGVLKEQLPTEEMEQLKEEQRNWLNYRDDTAKEASLKFEGGTMEHLEYVAVLANLTEERCFELVEKYMK